MSARMNESGPPITRYAFVNGDLRGSNLTLHPACLVHRSDSHLETLPLAAVTVVRVSFDRSSRKLGWGVVLLLLGLALLAIAAPLASFAGGAAGEMAVAGAQGASRMLLGFFRFLEAVAALLPVLALACVIAGGALGAFGWMGHTTLAVGIPGAERVYAARGRDTMLLDFAEALSERVTLVKR